MKGYWIPSNACSVGVEMMVWFLSFFPLTCDTKFNQFFLY
jgi:hypothetical protein